MDSVSGGGFFTCALMSDASAWCWGENNYGQLGLGTLVDSNLPGPVSGLGAVTAVAGGSEHACARLSDDSVQCWGRNTQGQLGDGTSVDRSVPGPVAGLTTVAQLALGGNITDGHSCARLTDGSLRCWGSNGDGQLGDGTTTDRLTATAVTGLPGPAIDVAPGGLHTCAVLFDGTVWCWGRNNYGQLGDGTGAGHAAPTAVIGLTTAIDVEAGPFHTCARLSDSSVECWGVDIVELARARRGSGGGGGPGGSVGALGTIVESNPIADTIMGVRSGRLALGVAHIISISSRGRISAWGLNNFGQLGDGTTSDSFRPTRTLTSGDGLSATSGWDHGCAVLTGGTLECWGRNSHGELGDGSMTNRLTPVAITF